MAGITNEKEAVVSVHEDKRHSYQNGDYVKFREVQGMTQINEVPHIRIKNCQNH